MALWEILITVLLLILMGSVSLYAFSTYSLKRFTNHWRCGGAKNGHAILLGVQWQSHEEDFGRIVVSTVEFALLGFGIELTSIRSESVPSHPDYSAYPEIEKEAQSLAAPEVQPEVRKPQGNVWR